MSDVLWFFLGAMSTGILWFFFWRNQSEHDYEQGYLDACECFLERLTELKENDNET